MTGATNRIRRWIRRAVFGLSGRAYRHLHLALPAAACVLVLSSTHILLAPVQNRSGDNMYHEMNEHTLAHVIKSGDDPFGPLGIEFGQPVLRFYQSLYYLFNVGLHLLFGLNLIFAHNLTIVICFALSPFGYLYFLRKLGLNRWAASIGSFATVLSVAAFGNSFEAYHQAGIVTQSVGGLFFPWFMGNYIGMLRGENRASTTAVLFAIAFLSHAIMPVFALFGGALYLAVTPIGIRAIWKKLTAFCILGAALVSFWTLPFLAHTYEMRPVPDSIIRGQGVHWFSSVSKEEMVKVLTTGRLLDDPPVLHKDQKDPLDQLMDRINIIGTLIVRPPVITFLCGLGTIFALFGLRRSSRRFLLTGFAFSLMLFAGPDDFRWVRHLPFIKQIQVFRCTYFIEFFAFGLVGIGVETPLRAIWRYFRRRKRFLRYPLRAAWFVAISAGAAWGGAEIVKIGRTHLVTRDMTHYDAMADACSSLPDKGYPFRVTPAYRGRVKLRHAWLAINGYQPYCTHWKGTGPTSTYHICMSLGSYQSNSDIWALGGLRFFSGERAMMERRMNAKDKDGDPIFERLANGKDRNNKSNNWHILLDSGRENFLRPLIGKPLPVVCSHDHWIWLNRSWIHRFKGLLWEEETPIPLRVRSGQLASSGLLEQSSVLLYLDDREMAKDLSAIEEFSSRGGIVISPAEIPSIKHEIPNSKKSIWDSLPPDMKPTPTSRSRKFPHREAVDPGFDIAEVKQLDTASRRTQHFVFDLDLLEPAVVILPMENIPGWGATLDGEPLQVFSTGPDMVGAFIPKGAHRIVYRWKMPTWQRVTLWISLAAVAAILCIWLLAAVGRLARGLRREKPLGANAHSS